MEQEESRKIPTKTQKLYSLCKNTVAILITLVALIPIIYLLGSDDSVYPNRPLFAAYADNPYFQGKLAEIQTALNSSFIVNLHWQGEKKESSDWQHLQEFVRYLGYQFNRHQLTTINRVIVPPVIKQQKKGKNIQTAENQQILEKAYSLASQRQLNVFKNKLNKAALGTITRLKIKQRDTKNGGISEVIRSKIVDEVLSRKIWIITIHPENWQYHSAEELRKQLTALSKEREMDRFVVVSIAPADSEWKRMKAISINIDDNVFSAIKTKVRQIVKASLPFEINATRLIETVLCHYQSSLFQLNNFLHSCNTTFSCHNSIKLLTNKKTKKEDNSQVMALLNELCNVGHIDEENLQFKDVLEKLGFYLDHNQAEESIKLYYEIANGKKCKGNKQCIYKWLQSEAKPKPTKVNQNQKPKKPQAIAPKPQQLQSKASNKTKSTAPSAPLKQQTSTQNKAKPLKEKVDKKAPIKQSKSTTTVNKIQKIANKTTIKVDKPKTAESITKTKSKQKKPKIVKSVVDQPKIQSPKLPCNEDLQIQQSHKDIKSQTNAIPPENVQNAEITPKEDPAVSAEASEASEAEEQIQIDSNAPTAVSQLQETAQPIEQVKNADQIEKIQSIVIKPAEEAFIEASEEVIPQEAEEVLAEKADETIAQVVEVESIAPAGEEPIASIPEQSTQIENVADEQAESVVQAEKQQTPNEQEQAEIAHQDNEGTEEVQLIAVAKIQDNQAIEQDKEPEDTPQLAQQKPIQTELADVEATPEEISTPEIAVAPSEVHEEAQLVEKEQKIEEAMPTTASAEVADAQQAKAIDDDVPKQNEA